MQKFFQNIFFSFLFLTGLSFNIFSTHAESLVDLNKQFQSIEITNQDLNHWIEVPQVFTSLAIQGSSDLKIEVLFNPEQPKKQSVIFEEENYSELLFTNPTKYFLISIQAKNLQSPLKIFLFDTRGEIKPLKSASTVNNLNGLKIISRQAWGADESLRYYTPEEELEKNNNSSIASSNTTACDKQIEAFPNEFKYASVLPVENGNTLKWPLQYSPSIKKIVIHHTGETDVTNGRPSDEMVRAIYYYHTIVKGWGDIGYHYIIGKDGEIFEGKAGGDKVVGAHVYCNNIGTIGVSVMGNFEITGISSKQVNGLKAILTKLTQKYNIKPDESSYFHGKFLPNIIGHRDLAATACPGKNFYSLIPEIRGEVAKGFTYQFTENTTTTQKDYDGAVEQKVNVLNLKPTHQAKLTFKFKNTGKQPWNDETWLHVALNNNTNAWAEPIVPDKQYVAADMKEKEVKPGQTGTFDITLNAGYKAGFYILEFAPVVNNKYKLSKSAILQPIEIEEPNYSYSFIKANHPPNPFYMEQSAEASIELKNTGNLIWRNYGENKIYLGTTGPQDRPSLFSSDGRKTRLGYLEEREVKPGEVGHFIMPLIAPSRIGIYKESFAPVIEGIRWLEDKNMFFRIVVKEPQFKIDFASSLNTITLDPGSKYTYNIAYTNLSDIDWAADQIFFRLAGDYQALGLTENTLMLSENVLKNKTGKSELKIESPLKNGTYRMTIVPVVRGKKFKDANSLTFTVNVKKPTLDAQLTSNPPREIKLQRNQKEEIRIQIKNTSNFIWNQKSIRLIPNNKKSRLYVENQWISKEIVTYMEEENVAPGKTANFILKLAPKYRGIFFEIFKLEAENLGIFKTISLPLRVFVEMDKLPQKNVSKPSLPTSNNISKPETTIFNQPKKNTLTSTNNIRIRLSVSKQDQYEITAKENFIILGDNGIELFKLNQNQTVLIRLAGKYLNIQANNQSKVAQTAQIIPQNNGIFEIINWEHRPAWNQTLNDNTFRGSLELRILDNQITFINELPLEDYLKGIAEVSNNDPTEKLKTMAVIARSYAKFYLQPENIKFPGKPYDGSDDPNQFQKYLGYNLELRSPNFIKAVEATKEEVVTYQGKLIKTPYFNQSNGKTLSAKEVWGWENTPYLISVDDPYCQGLKQNGHGVGLSGYGATQMAKNGKTYQEIIKYYYQGVGIEKQ